MTIVEELADAALARDALRVRSIAQQLGRSGQSFESLPRPLGNAMREIVSAALLDLIAVRKSLVFRVEPKMSGGFPNHFIF